MSTIEISCIFKTMTPKAAKIDAGTKEVWLPLSALPQDAQAALENAEEGDAITIEIPEWLAKEKGLI